LSKLRGILAHINWDGQTYSIQHSVASRGVVCGRVRWGKVCRVPLKIGMIVINLYKTLKLTDQPPKPPPKGHIIPVYKIKHIFCSHTHTTYVQVYTYSK